VGCFFTFQVQNLDKVNWQFTFLGKKAFYNGAFSVLVVAKKEFMPRFSPKKENLARINGSFNIYICPVNI